MPFRPKLPPRFSIRRKVVFGFSFVLAMLAAIALITWRSTRTFMRTAEFVAHTRFVLEKEETVLRYLMEMESARRGYLITGQEKYQQNYETAHTEVISSFNVLRSTIDEDAMDQRLRADHIQTLLREYFARQDEEIEARRIGGFESGSELFTAGRSDEVIRDILTVLNDFEMEERALLREREEYVETMGNATTLVIVVGTAITLVALLIATTLIMRDIAARRRAEEALAEQTHLLTSILDAMPELVYVKDVQGRYILDNRSHRAYLGVAEGGIEGKTVYDFFPQDLAGKYAEDDRKVIEQGRQYRNVIEPARPASVIVRWLSTNKVPLRGLGGRVLGLVGVSSDITERKEAEEKLRRLNDQLERSNAELQSFATVASHDLQEPLRKIQAFGDRLRAKSGSALGEQGLDYLARMQNAAERMRVLIQDLLKLSRVTSRAQPFQPCNLSQIVQEVLTDLEVAIETKKATVEVAELPTIDGDALQMRQLFQNLIANAIKFQKPDVPPVVRISSTNRVAEDHTLAGARPGDALVDIFVEDNGIGFEQKFADQIFVVFQRLHTREEYEGTGMGLAVCRKITDRHGGSIVAKSAPGAGATFIITLPVKQIRTESA